ncbi:MAG: 3-deoxy-manno-octulosonate cytidylyltransferase [Candidatus Omnitrophica bacterium CG1_02_44_16]|nr:MAG: 3-deoxy-manno-octulosonate cytidylyltransferase [Candidatus Omnitrophica bacterium CG1_02_44_16]PIY82562.1 MAG: 3-deoxy-manno-octulosonate cytidylyltransferase [Candidatus Omnitrophica bacterium CG_4_10_14_0_8_um_filter_44_12]PIZ83929.1 MAG: 3-deoxy-manno-octulosonate cytidylyltransferase [Candidatus Omnitrophica bacterium CG_4_10_14_0_2_um_filter_44_9]
MKAIGVIPARYSSVRFEGKVLADILGKPMIQHVWESAKKAKTLDDLVVACDDDRIYKVVSDFGGRAVMTAKAHTSGTERITEVVTDMAVRLVVNIQGDEPLIHPSMIDDVVYSLTNNPELSVATIMKRIEDEKEITDANVVKVVVNKKGYALYFSRCPIPFVREEEPGMRVHYKHIGLYGYTKDFLFTYKNLPDSKLEKLEKLEQLRILENGYPIRVIETKYETIGVDTREDLDKVRQWMVIKSKM